MSSEQYLLPLLNQSNWTLYSFYTEPAYSQNQSEAGYSGWAAYSTQQMPGMTTGSISGTYSIDMDIIKACRVIISGYAVLALCIFGLLGNVVTIIVLKRDPNQESTTVWLLKALAVTDSSCLFFALLFIVISYILRYIQREISRNINTLYYAMRLVLSPMSHVTNSLTIWLVILVTIDRYLAICKPLNVSWRNLRRMKLTVLVLFLLAVLFSIPSILAELVVIRYIQCIFNYNLSMTEYVACEDFYITVSYGLRIYDI